jgi:hypothetical protein
LSLAGNSLTGTIPSEVGLLTKLSELSVVWFASCNDYVVMCFFIVLSCLLVIFLSRDYLYLDNNSLTGTIPSEVGLMLNLGESSVVWLLVVMIVLSCVFHCTLMLACHIHSTASLSLNYNSLTGTIPSQVGLLTTLSESIVVLLLVVMIVMCFSLYSHACLSYSFYSWVGSLLQ